MEQTFESRGTLRLCAFSCRCGASIVVSSIPGSFAPEEGPSRIVGAEDS